MMRKPIWLECLAEAFILRPSETGLSVCFDCSPDRCANISRLNPSHGAATLGFQSVTTLGLTVESDAAIANYAQIMGLPNPNDSDAAADAAESMASELAKVATNNRQDSSNEELRSRLGSIRKKQDSRIQTIPGYPQTQIETPPKVK
jgi:hypothetical protein